MRFIQRTQTSIAVLGLGVILIAGCGESAENSQVSQDPAAQETAMDSEGMSVTTRQSTLTKIFHAAPSPMETASLIKRSGAHFHADALNPAAQSAQYTTSDRQAINLGIYGADLSYATIFEENSTSIDYLEAIQSLSTALGVNDVLSDEVMGSVEDNRNDRQAADPHCIRNIL